VERPFRYIREDFFLGGTFRDLDDLNLQFVNWLGNVANPRVRAYALCDIDSDENFCRMFHGSSSSCEDRLGPPEQPSEHQYRGNQPLSRNGHTALRITASAVIEQAA
jgi:hypothetical protein